VISPAAPRRQDEPDARGACANPSTVLP
jgi:hypothetical protein